MAMTVGQVATTDEDVFAELRFKVIDLVFDTTYPAGGYSNVRRTLGFPDVLWALVPLVHATSPNAQPLLSYDMTADKLHFYVSTAAGWGTEYAGGSSMAGTVVRCMAIGR